MDKDLRKIKGFDRYLIDANSNIISTNVYPGGRLLKKKINLKGYEVVNLRKNKEMFTVQIHRIVAETFIPNPENKPQVNHKNGIKHDNRVENLEWSTARENMKHSFDKLNRTRLKYRLSLDDVKEIKEMFVGGVNGNKKTIIEKFRISYETLMLIVNNKMYKSERKRKSKISLDSIKSLLREKTVREISDITGYSKSSIYRIRMNGSNTLRTNIDS